MTQDTNPGHLYTTPPRKSYNPFDSDDDTLEPTDLKSHKVFAKEDCIGFDLKTLEESADALTFDMDKGEFSWEEALLVQPAVETAANGQLYTDKNVMECETPEFIICCKETSYQSVKDIGIDEGACKHNKIRDQTGEDDKENDEYEVLEAQKSKLDEDPKADGLNQEVKTQLDDDSLKIFEGKLDLEAHETFPPKTAEFAAEVDSSKNDSEHGEPDFPHKDGAVHEVDEIVCQEPKRVETPSELETENEEGKAKLNEIPNKEEISPASFDHDPTQESASTSDSDDSPTNSDTENKLDDQENNIEAAKPPTTQAMTRNDQPLLQEPTVHSFSSIVSIPPPSSITFSGPVSYSGSISLRSESSAGSTRSFAFPVLQAEWNSSPVRMAKADHRRFRKQRGWLQAVICCRF